MRLEGQKIFLAKIDAQTIPSSIFVAYSCIWPEIEAIENREKRAPISGSSKVNVYIVGGAGTGSDIIQIWHANRKI